MIFAKEVLNLGKRVGFVSPELHGRPHLPIWEEIKKFELHRNRFFELCTDFPEAAFDFFGEKKTTGSILIFAVPGHTVG